MKPDDPTEGQVPPFESREKCLETWKTLLVYVQKQTAQVDAILQRMVTTERNLEVIRVETVRNSKCIAEFLERCLKCEFRHTISFTTAETDK